MSIVQMGARESMMALDSFKRLKLHASAQWMSNRTQVASELYHMVYFEQTAKR
jgi:hypothetical protein